MLLKKSCEIRLLAAGFISLWKRALLHAISVGYLLFAYENNTQREPLAKHDQDTQMQRDLFLPNVRTNYKPTLPFILILFNSLPLFRCPLNIK